MRHATKIKRKILDTYSFASSWIRNPKQVGALCATSKKFAQKITQNVDWSSYVIELGAGYGNVTKELIHNRNTDNFACIEIDSKFCQQLRKKFPQINVAEGSAENLHTLFPEMVGKVSTIVSVLPMVSLPKSVVARIFSSCQKMLSPTGYILQGSYYWKPYALPQEFQSQKMDLVFRNFPPINIYKYSHIHHTSI